MHSANVHSAVTDNIPLQDDQLVLSLTRVKAIPLNNIFLLIDNFLCKRRIHSIDYSLHVNQNIAKKDSLLGDQPVLSLQRQFLSKDNSKLLFASKFLHQCTH